MCVCGIESRANVSNASTTRLDFTVNDVCQVTTAMRWQFLMASVLVRLSTINILYLILSYRELFMRWGGRNLLFVISVLLPFCFSV